MRKLYHRLMAFAAVIPLAAGGTASASIDNTSQTDESAWAQAAAKGTIEAYTTFAIAYPDSAFADEARSRLMKVKIPASAASKRDGAMDADDDGNFGTRPSFIPDSIMVV
jgi:hypothetical protein